MTEQIIEIFGKRVKFVQGDGTVSDCDKCSLFHKCERVFMDYICEDTKGQRNTYFVEVDENGNEI